MIGKVNEEDPGLPGIDLRDGESVSRVWLNLTRVSTRRIGIGFLLQSQKLRML